MKGIKGRTTVDAETTTLLCLQLHNNRKRKMHTKHVTPELVLHAIKIDTTVIKKENLKLAYYPNFISIMQHFF
jgi:hypothetical protein